MRTTTRVLLWKIGTVAALLALVFAAMHFLLPGLATLREQRQLGERFEQIETEHLRLWAPRGTRDAPALASTMERFATALYGAYGEPLSLRPLEEKITVRLFTTQEQLARDAKQRGMTKDLSHAIGFYNPRDWSIAITLRERDSLLPLVFHETVHLLMDRPDQPRAAKRSTWISEGVAVFFEHSDVTDDEIRLGGVDPLAARHIVALARTGRHVPLRDLITRPALFDSDRAPLCYSEAGTLVAYLLTGANGRYRKGFLRHVAEDLQRGAASSEALELHLGVAIQQLERQWLTFLQRMSP